MKQVVLEELALAGFGRFAGEVRLSLGPGLWNLVAENEQGKSTLVAGLMAVLFGLPRSGEGFSQERLRNWYGPPRFWGAVTLRVDGVRYRVERNFDRNEVTVLEGEPGRMRQLFRAAHRPGARRPDERYETWLREHLGIGTLDLFAATFCLTQPLPEADQLSAQVQELLAGAGAGSFEAALQLLADWARAVTRYTGDLGLTPGNRRQDQELEQVEAEIARLEAEIQRSAAALDGLQAVSQELEAARQQVEKLQRQRQEQAALLEAWRQWLDLQGQRRQALRRVTELQEAVRAAERLQARQAEIRAAMAAYPEWLQAGPALAERLAELARLREEADRIGREMARLEAGAQETERQLGDLRRRLQEEYGDVAGRPDLPALHRELRRLREELARLNGRLESLAQEEEEVRRRLEALRPWDRLGQAPATALAQLRPLAREAYRVREQLERSRAAARAAREELDRHFAWFEAASPEQREALANYPTLRARLEAEVQAREAELKSAEERHRAWEAEAAAFRATYGDLEALDDQALEAVSQKVDLLAEERRRKEELGLAEAAVRAARERQRRIRSVAAGVAGVAASIVTGFLASWLGLGAVAIAALVTLAGGLSGIAAWMLAGRHGRDEAAEARAAAARQALAEIAARIRDLDSRLGPFAGADAVALGELRRRLQDRQQARERLARLEAEAPSPAVLAELRERLAAARASLANLEREVAAAGEGVVPGEAAAAGPAERYARWRERRRRLEEAEARLREVAAAEFGVGPEEVEGLPVTALEGKWRALAALAEVTGNPCATARDLLNWIGELASDHWQEWAEEARAWEAADRRLREMEVERRQLEAPGPDGRIPRERLEAEIASLAEAIRPFTPETDPEELARRVQEAAALEQSAQEAAAALATLRRELATLAERRAELDRAAAALAETLAPVLGPVGGDVAAARERQAAFAALQEDLARAERDLALLLEARGVQSPAELADRLEEARSVVFGAKRQQQELYLRFPALPHPDDEHDPAGLQAAYAELQAQAEATERDLRAAEAAELDLRRRQAELQGREVINVAAAELELRQLRARREELIRKRDALALAYHELKAAVEAYQATHRERLSEAATAHFAAITGRPGRQVVLGPDFLVTVYEPDGREVTPDQLSQGARDQLYFALRLAIADLLADAVRLPLILDDPFVTSDRTRLGRIRETLERVSGERQVLLLAHDPAYRTWGQPAALDLGDAPVAQTPGGAPAPGGAGSSPSGPAPGAAADETLGGDPS
ncbi:MAG: hypothetical protein DIU70_008025 [Bacillota bacterium]